MNKQDYFAFPGEIQCESMNWTKLALDMHQ
jgi:hypothetical protein